MALFAVRIGVSRPRRAVACGEEGSVETSRRMGEIFSASDKNGKKRPTKLIFSADCANPCEVESMKNLIGNLTCNPAIIYNQFCGQLTDRLPGPAKEAECFLMPDCPNPFTCTRKVQKVYDEIFFSLVGKRTGGKIRALLRMVKRFFSAGRF